MGSRAGLLPASRGLAAARPASTRSQTTRTAVVAERCARPAPSVAPGFARRSPRALALHPGPPAHWVPWPSENAAPVSASMSGPTRRTVASAATGARLARAAARRRAQVSTAGSLLVAPWEQGARPGKRASRTSRAMRSASAWMSAPSLARTAARARSVRQRVAPVVAGSACPPGWTPTIAAAVATPAPRLFATAEHARLAAACSEYAAPARSAWPRLVC